VGFWFAVTLADGLIENEDHQADKQNWAQNAQPKRRKQRAFVAQIIERFFLEDGAYVIPVHRLSPRSHRGR